MSNCSPLQIAAMLKDAYSDYLTAKWRKCTCNEGTSSFGYQRDGCGCGKDEAVRSAKKKLFKALDEWCKEEPK